MVTRGPGAGSGRPPLLSRCAPRPRGTGAKLLAFCRGHTHLFTRVSTTEFIRDKYRERQGYNENNFRDPRIGGRRTFTSNTGDRGAGGCSAHGWARVAARDRAGLRRVRRRWRGSRRCRCACRHRFTAEVPGCEGMLAAARARGQAHPGGTRRGLRPRVHRRRVARRPPRRQATRWRRPGAGLDALGAGCDAGLRRCTDVGRRRRGDARCGAASGQPTSCDNARVHDSQAVLDARGPEVSLRSRLQMAQ